MAENKRSIPQDDFCVIPKDPIIHWLFRSRWPGLFWGAFCLGIVGYLVVPVALTLVEGTFYPGKVGLPMLQYLPYQVVFSILLFILFYNGLALFNKINSTLNYLLSSRSIEFRQLSKDDFVEFARKAFSNRVWWWIALIACLSVTIIGGLVSAWSYEGGIFSQINSATGIFIRLIAGLETYFIVLCLSRQVVMIRVLWVLFHREDVKLQILHPDGAAGLRPLGSYSLMSNVTVFCAGLLIAAWSLGQFLTGSASGVLLATIITIYIGYLLVGVGLFLLPLLSAHHSMQSSKVRFLKEVSDSATALFERIPAALKEKDEAPKEHFVVEMKALHDLYNMGARVPVWPFNLAILTRFIGTIVLPALLSVFIALILQFLNL